MNSIYGYVMKKGNFVKLMIFSGGYYIYWEIGMPYLVAVWEWAPFFNLIALPFLFGFIAYYVFNGDYLSRCGHVFFIPLVSLIPQLVDSSSAEFYYYAVGLVSGFVTGSITGLGFQILWERIKIKRHLGSE